MTWSDHIRQLDAPCNISVRMHEETTNGLGRMEGVNDDNLISHSQLLA